MVTTVNGNNGANTITVMNRTGGGYTVNGAVRGNGDYFDPAIIINTQNATGGTDFVNLSGLTAASGVTSVTVNGGGGIQVITGGEPAGTFNGAAGNDTITGGVGNDTIIGGADNDSLNGGDGSDTYKIAGLDANGDTFNDTGINGTDVIEVTGTLTLTSFGPATGGTYTTTGTYAGIETIDGKGFTINGVNNGIGIIDFSGFTTVTNLGTINTADATGGFDYVNVSTSNASVTINGGGGKQIIVGSAFNDTIDGKSGDDEIYGGAGDDTLTGGTGADSMNGGAGTDTFKIAGLEASGDTFIGGDDTDTILVTGPLTLTSFGVAGKDYSTVFSGGPTAAGATYSGIEVFDGKSQTINGVNNGSDILDFSGFSITQNLGTINTFDATRGTDYVNVSTATAGVTVNGAGGVQIIVGGSGEDTLTGGAGNDTLTGGSGNDVFRYGTGNAGADTITDYSVTLTTLNFEDIVTSTETAGPIGNYQGFSWFNTGVVNADGSYVGPTNTNPNLNGYKAQSGTQIAFIGSALNDTFVAPKYPEPAGQPVIIDSLTGDFHFVSAYFSAAARDGLQITAEAYDDGSLVGQKTFTINKGTTTAGPTFVSFTDGLVSGRFWDIDRLKFISNDSNNDTNDYFGFDDFTYGVGDVIDLASGVNPTTSISSGDTLINLSGSGSGTITLDNYTDRVLFV